MAFTAGLRATIPPRPRGTRIKHAGIAAPVNAILAAQVATATAAAPNANPTGPSQLSNPITVTQNTTATNDLTADGYTWAQGDPMAVDQYGKIMALVQRTNAGSKRHLMVVSNDNGATWSEPTRIGFFDAAGEGFLIRGSMAHDPTHDLFHVCWALLQADGGVYYRQYSVTRDGSNNITSVTRVRQMQLEAGVSTMSYEFPVATWCADIGAVLLGWSATNTATSPTKAEVRLTMRVVSASAADVVTTNWKAPLNENAGAGSTDTLSSSGLVKYSCLAKSASSVMPTPTLARKSSGAATHANDLVFAYILAGTTLRFNRATWSGANSDWRTGLGSALANDAGIATVTAILRAGTDTGYNGKYQLLAKIVEDTVNDKLWVGLSTWKDNTAGDTWTIYSINGSDAVSSPIDVYTAGSANTDAGRDIFVTGDLMYDTTSSLLVVSYTDLMRHDGYVATYANGALSQSPLVFYTATPVDIPTLHPVRVNNKLAILFRDFNVGARSNPPTYTPPYHGFYVTLDWSSSAVNGVMSGQVATAPAQVSIARMATQYAAVVVSDGPSAYWRLDEPSGTAAADLTGNGHGGTYTGGYTLAQAGATAAVDSDTSVAVNGSTGYVTVPYSAGLNTSAFTVELWVYPTGGAGTFRGVAASRGYPNGWVIYAADDDTWQFWINNGAGMDAIAGSAITLNTWAHLVATYDGTTARLYVNGTQAASAASGAYTPNSSAVLAIGQGNPGDGFWFTGRVDEVAVYATALSSTRVAAHYAAAGYSTGAAALVAQVATAPAASPNATMPAGAKMTGVVAAATATSPSAIELAGAVLPAVATTATATAPAGTLPAGAVLGALVGAATAASPAGALVTGGLLVGVTAAATAASPNATDIGGALMGAALATAPAASPVAALTGAASGGVVLGAVVAQATASSPSAAGVAGALVGAQVATASAAVPNATEPAGATLTAILAAAVASSPNAAAVAGGLMSAATATATGASAAAGMSGVIAGAGLFVAQIASATAVAPNATAPAGALVPALTATATAVTPVAAIVKGGTLVAVTATSTASSPNATNLGGATVTALTATSTAASPTAATLAGAKLTAIVTTATAASPVSALKGSGTVLALTATATGTSPTAVTITGARALAQVATATAASPAAALQVLAAGVFPAVIGGALAGVPAALLVGYGHAGPTDSAVVASQLRATVVLASGTRAVTTDGRLVATVP